MVQSVLGSREIVTAENWCPMPHLTTLVRRHGPWYPVGRWQSWYDRVSRVPTYQTDPLAKLKSDEAGLPDNQTPEQPWPTTKAMCSKAAWFRARNLVERGVAPPPPPQATTSPWRAQAWDWVLPRKTEIYLSSGAAVSLLGGFGGMLPREIFFNRYSLLQSGSIKIHMYCTKKNRNLTFLRKITIIIMILVARCMVDLYHFISKILPIPGNIVKLFPYLI